MNINMDKTIKELNINKLTYKLGYDLWDNKVYPRIEMFKDNKLLLGGGGWIFGSVCGLTVFHANRFASYSTHSVNSIKEMFFKLRQYSNIPEEIEKEFELLFILYKINNFNEF